MTTTKTLTTIRRGQRYDFLAMVLVAILAASCHSVAHNPGSTVDSGARHEDGTLAERDSIRASIEAAMVENDVPAVSVGIVKDGKIALLEGFGVLERGGDRRIDEHSIYQIGSQTKMLTGIIATRLIAEGRLGVDMPIVPLLPQEVTSQARERLRRITVGHLLLHRSGIPSTPPGSTRIDGDPMLAGFTKQDLLRDLNSLELDFEPGEKTEYSNFGYAILGYLCEITTDLDYATLLRNYVSEEYDLASVVIEPGPAQESLIPVPYRKDDRSIASARWKMGKLVPGGGAYSSVVDLSRLQAQQIKAYRRYIDGSKPSPLVLTETTVPYRSEGMSYGFGLIEMAGPDGATYGHGGDLDGFGCEYFFSPERNVGLVLLTSSGGRWLGELAMEIFQSL